MNNNGSGRPKCQAVESECICIKSKGHKGAHLCKCDGSWYYDKNGNFHIESLPDIAKGFGAFPNSPEEEAIIRKEVI